LLFSYIVGAVDITDDDDDDDDDDYLGGGLHIE